MTGSKARIHLRAVTSIAAILLLYFLDDHYFGPLSGDIFWQQHVFLHRILVAALVCLAGCFTYIKHPVKWTLTLWVGSYLAAIAGLMIVKMIFLFVNDPYHLQIHATEFVRRYFLSILPFLGLYVLALFVNK
ncbi:MAG: hypothetical protein ACTHJ0_11950 [Flavipsychrobacter sp.]